MEFEWQDKEGEIHTFTVDWTVDRVYIEERGRTETIVDDWWITDIDGRKPTDEERRAIYAEFDEMEMSIEDSFE